MSTTKINNRRYLGNKYKLLPFITEVISAECGNFNTFADIFAGTGAVSSAYTDKSFIRTIFYIAIIFVTLLGFQMRLLTSQK